jgi:hypothetical protein
MLVSGLKDTLKDIEAELAAQTDRGAAIIGCAILDDFLAEAIEARLILTTSTKERLFNHEKNGPLADFSSKINLANALGILTAKMRDDMHQIRRIRNRFAHRAEPLKFSDPKIKSWCDNLTTPLFESDPRKRYTTLCAAMSAAMAITARLPVKLTEVYANRDLQDKSQAVLRELFDQYMRRFDFGQKA